MTPARCAYYIDLSSIRLPSPLVCYLHIAEYYGRLYILRPSYILHQYIVPTDIDYNNNNNEMRYFSARLIFNWPVVFVAWFSKTEKRRFDSCHIFSFDNIVLYIGPHFTRRTDYYYYYYLFYDK